jgi:translation initiation factor IF-2
MDKPHADVERVKDQLAQNEIYTEDRGGEIVTVQVSAKAKTGLVELEDAIMLQAEILDLR